ncbi:MAG: helix-turn-helix domain-containing protein [Phycisphaerales bacterium]|nr:helix-turn-helix domain-containing protein [Phycisphaerales bacterium]
MKSDEFKVEQVAFGKAVRKFRLRAKLSQEKLAALAGLHRNYMGTAERGQQNVSLASICRICRALNVSLKQLATEMEKQQAE